ncbi:carcinoembryonic antigen-related cell adhesion molecule 5-like [Dreissena polymorpha]|nr:carcinoembryonic antigen-related cell adhesion molecule 5-like [Dreissena polymorpha]
MGITGISLLPVSTVNIIADTIGTLVCRTSGGLPAAKVTWFKEASTGRVNLTSFSTSEASMQDGLIVVTSTITLRPSKNDNSIRIYCNASNIGALYISQTSIINVLYSPDTPICTYRESVVTSVVHVTRGSTLNITCTSTGNPPDITYIWTLPDTSTRNGFIFSVVNIQPYQNGQYRVSVSNNMTPTIGTAVIGTNSVTMLVIVEYPPLSPTLKIGNITVSGTIRIIAGQSVTISCSSQSNPPPDLYYWAPGGTRNITDLELRNVQPSDYDGVYTCTVQNHLSPTRDKPFTGMSSSSVNLEVLYPPANPKIHIDNTHGIEVLGKKLGIVYGANITLACQADSNPSPTYSWPNQLWTGIVKQNITITCNVSNIMNPTVHARVSGNIVATITLYVIYEPEQPTLFYVINETISETSATVTWLPQFNGGIRQLFQLQYRASSIDSWTIHFFNDTSSNILKPMYAAINNLQSAMEYHVELFAIMRMVSPSL